MRKLNGEWLYQHAESVFVTGGEYRGALRDIFKPDKLYETNLTEEQAKELERIDTKESFSIGFMFVNIERFGWVKVYLW